MDHSHFQDRSLVPIYVCDKRIVSTNSVQYGPFYSRQFKARHSYWQINYQIVLVDVFVKPVFVRMIVYWVVGSVENDSGFELRFSRHESMRWNKLHVFRSNVYPRCDGCCPFLPQNSRLSWLLRWKTVHSVLFGSDFSHHFLKYFLNTTGLSFSSHSLKVFDCVVIALSSAQLKFTTGRQPVVQSFTLFSSLM